MATGISRQRGSGASQNSCGYRLQLPNDEARLPWKNSRRVAKVKEVTEWTLKRIREAYEKVAKDEIGRLGIVQGIF